LKHKNLLLGIVTGLLWTGFGMFLILLFFSEVSIEESIRFFYKQKRLGGIISLAALINLPLFFVALRRNKIQFAKGILIVSLFIVVLIALLKLM